MLFSGSKLIVGFDGFVEFCVLENDYETAIEVDRPFVVTPEIKSAIKSLDGVVMVEDI